DLTVPGDACVVDHDDSVAEPTIVGDVTHCNDEAARADLGPFFGVRRPVDRHVLPDGRVGADPDPRRRTVLELEVLGPAAEDRSVADLGAVADLDAALQHAVMTDLGVGADRCPAAE